MTHRAITAALAAIAFVGLAAPGSTREQQRRGPPPADMSGPAPSRFYPEEIEGGSRGNLPFNNQIRKLKDPLNANGAK